MHERQEAAVPARRHARGAGFPVHLVRRTVAVGWVAACLFFGAGTQAAGPQSGGQAPGAGISYSKLSAQERQALLARLSDAQVRELLLRELQTPSAATDKPLAPAALAGAQSATARIRQNLADILEHVGDLSVIFLFAATRVAGGDDSAHLLTVLASITLMLLAGTAGEWLFRRATGSARRRCESGSGGRLGRLFPRLILDVLALAVFALAATGTFALIYYGLERDEPEPLLLFALTILAALIIVRLSSALTRFVLAPNTPPLRLVALSDARARRLHRWVVAVTTLLSFGFLGCGLMLLLGLVPPLYELLLIMLGFVVTAALAAMIWQSRAAIAELIRGGPEAPAGQTAQVFADIWHWLAIAYVVALYAFITIARLAGHELGLGVWVGSLLIVVAVPLIDAAMCHGLGGFFGRRGATGAAGQPEGYERVLRRGLRTILLLLAAAALLGLWGVDIYSVAERGVGGAVTRTMLDIALTLLLAYVGWGLAKIAIDRRLAAQTGSGAQAASAEDEAPASRLHTLLPLLRRFLQITIVVMVVMIVLSSLGVNVGPLVAGAGVVGLAIGFGAQTLVRDIVSGMFFLLDDAFRLGEYIDIGSVKGTVEAIHVRSLVLRHHRGALHTVPFGEIKRLTNYSRDWAIMKLEFRVPYDTDIDKVKKIFKQIGARLLEDENLGPNFIEPLKSQGVTEMDDSAMIIRAKFKALAGKQFEIRKQVYADVQKAFQEHGIKFAHRRVMVDLPPGIDPVSAQGKAIADAAAAAALVAPGTEKRAPSP